MGLVLAIVLKPNRPLMVIVIVFILFSMYAGTRYSLPNCIEVDQIAVSNAIEQVVQNPAVEQGAEGLGLRDVFGVDLEQILTP